MGTKAYRNTYKHKLSLNVKRWHLYYLHIPGLLSRATPRTATSHHVSCQTCGWVLFIPSFLGDICSPLITNHQPVTWCYATSPRCFPFQVHEAWVWLLIGDQTADGRKSGRTNTQNLPLLKSDLLHLTWSAGFFPSTVRGNKANEASEDDQENVHKIGPMFHPLGISAGSTVLPGHFSRRPSTNLDSSPKLHRLDARTWARFPLNNHPFNSPSKKSKKFWIRNNRVIFLYFFTSIHIISTKYCLN